MQRQKSATIGASGVMTALAATLAVSGTASATSVARMTDAEMVAEARFIVHATVTDVRSEWSADGTYIYTFVELASHAQLKGEPLGDALTLRVLGGALDGVGMDIVDAPVFRAGDEAILLLDENPQTWFPVVGFNQGKLDVEAGMVPARGVALGAMLGRIERLLVDPDSEFLDEATGAASALLGPAPATERFRVAGTNAQIATAGPISAPHELPPFLHWDLREFPSCRVPYTFYDGTPDIAGTAEFSDVTQAFSTWQGVLPTVISFEAVGPADGALCPLRRDHHNMIGWNGFACSMPGDDQWLVAAADQACGKNVGAGTNIIGAGTDLWLTTIRNAGCPAGGDDVFGAGAQITAGLNGIVDTVPNAGMPASAYALTARFYRTADGALLESDILLNDAGTWATMAHNDRMQGNLDVRTIALHEIGHLLGLQHADADTNLLANPPGPIMNSKVENSGGDDIWVVAAGNQRCGANVGVNAQIIGAGPNVFLDMLFSANNCPGGGDDVVDGAINGIHAGPNGLVETVLGNANHILAVGDADGLRFLYTPDLGDAPDPLGAQFNHYPSNVHSTAADRMLNGVQLYAPAEGAAHLYGYVGADPASPRYQYEWLGADGDPPGSVDGHVTECEARVPDADSFDDGISFGQDFAPGGAAVLVTVLIRTGTDRFGNAHAYNANNRMFINGWFDWNADGDWDDAGEHAIGAGAGSEIGVAGENDFNVSAPAAAREGGFARFRLDYREDVDEGNAGLSPDLSGPRGPAQFGEVEDYLIPYLSLCQGDLNDDDLIGFGDLTLVLLGWGPCLPPCPADVTGDGEVGFADLTYILLNWGACRP